MTKEMSDFLDWFLDQYYADTEPSDPIYINNIGWPTVAEDIRYVEWAAKTMGRYKSYDIPSKCFIVLPKTQRTY